MDETNISFNTLLSISKASIAMQVVLVSVAILMTWDDWYLYQVGDTFLFLVPAALILALIVCYRMDNNLVRRIDKSMSTEDKLADYVRHSTTKLGLLELAGTMAIVMLFFKTSTIYLLYFIIAFIAFIILRPTKKQFIKWYQLSTEEQIQLEL